MLTNPVCTNEAECSGAPVDRVLEEDPELHFQIDSGYYKIDAGEWFSTDPSDCSLIYTWSFNDETGDRIENHFSHLFSQSFYEQNKMWVKTSKWQDPEDFETADKFVYYMQVLACNTCDLTNHAIQTFKVYFDRVLPPEPDPVTDDEDTDTECCNPHNPGGDGQLDCDDDILTDPLWTNKFMTSYLFQVATFSFALPTSTMADCGNWEFSIVDCCTDNEYDTDFIYMIDRPAGGY